VLVQSITPVLATTTFAFNPQLISGVRMAQRDNRQPEQLTTLMKCAAMPDRSAGRGGPVIIPLPVYHGDVCGSLLGAMLFPSDRAKADSFCAHLATGPLQDYLREGYVLSSHRQIPLFEAISRGISSREIETKKVCGQRVGEVVKVLFALIYSHPKIASWEAAIWIVEDEWTGAGISVSRATLRAALSAMSAVLHLWGAFALRDYKFLTYPALGYDGLEDLTAFMNEAMALLQYLCIWRDGRHKPDKLLAGDAIGPWLDWQPYNEPRPGWPDTGRIHPVKLHPSVRIPVPGPSGRPVGRRNSVQ
jgi:hypothetical protein